ncbi:MAG: endonuclease III [Acidimicrobiales bacterium]|nr:MAG: endonuclease III [Acidimicrobiales bacterium]
MRSGHAGKPRTPGGRARKTVARLASVYPGTVTELCALAHQGPFQLLVATILSAQSTDEGVNRVTPSVFESWPTPADLAAADTREVEQAIQTLGLFRSKARALVGMAAALVERFDGQVPSAMDDLVSLPGVGRKTANVVRSVGFGLPGLPVDTHVGRLARRLGLTTETDPTKVESDLNAAIAPGERGTLSLRLILHGRRVCLARAPRCAVCVLADYCPSAVVGAVAEGGNNRSGKGVTLGTRDQVPAT